MNGERLALQFPGLAHHVVKVDVLIDRRTHSGVIVRKFLLRHLRTFVTNCFALYYRNDD